MKISYRYLLKTFILIHGLSLFSNNIQAIELQYQLASQGGGIWNYTFNLFNNGNSGVNVQSFTVDFNSTHFDETTLTVTIPSNWVGTVFPSGPGFPATLDFYSTNVTPVAVRQSITGFVARVTSLGGFTPGTLPYLIYSTTLTILGNGATVPVDDGGGGVVVPAVVSVPTLHFWALLLLVILMMTMAVNQRRLWER